MYAHNLGMPKYRIVVYFTSSREVTEYGRIANEGRR